MSEKSLAWASAKIWENLTWTSSLKLSGLCRPKLRRREIYKDEHFSDKFWGGDLIAYKKSDLQPWVTVFKPAMPGLTSWSNCSSGGAELWASDRGRLVRLHRRHPWLHLPVQRLRRRLLPLLLLLLPIILVLVLLLLAGTVNLQDRDLNWKELFRGGKLDSFVSKGGKRLEGWKELGACSRRRQPQTWGLLQNASKEMGKFVFISSGKEDARCT